RNKAVGRDRRRNLGQKIALHIDPFRAVLLDECTARDGALDFGAKAQPASRGALDEPHALQRRPKPVDECPQTLLSSIRRVSRSYIEPFGKEVGGPTGA